MQPVDCPPDLPKFWPHSTGVQPELCIISHLKNRSGCSRAPALTLGLVLAADVALVAAALQGVQQVAVVQLSCTVGLIPARDLGNLDVTCKTSRLDLHLFGFSCRRVRQRPHLLVLGCFSFLTNDGRVLAHVLGQVPVHDLPVKDVLGKEMKPLSSREPEGLPVASR